MIEILETPPLNTIQDLGRPGNRRYGVARGGALDRVALAAANILLGNEDGAAGIEVQLFPVRIRLGADSAVAITGAAAEARLDGRVLPPWWAVPIRAGQELSLTVPATGMQGMRAYLAFAGGLDVPVVLGGRGTQIRDAFGGLEGRALQAGDCLATCAAASFRFRDAAGFGACPPTEALPQAMHGQAGMDETVLRVIPASEYDQFDDTSHEAFWQEAFTITAQSDRMGYRLAGPVLRRTEPVEMRSHGIVPGVVQVPPSGLPIIQLADGNSAGGYPKIGVVLDGDLWRLAQAPPGRRLRFRRCEVTEARAAEQETAHYLTRLRRLSGYLRLGAVA